VDEPQIQFAEVREKSKDAPQSENYKILLWNKFYFVQPEINTNLYTRYCLFRIKNFSHINEISVFLVINKKN
jgi:hypothetical protein